MIDDIGTLVFSQLLGIAQYPGSPFTGNLFRDIIMFLIVPTIFIILVVYSMVGRIVADPKLRAMLGVGAYLFIVAGGYYSIFALLAGPYFLFLIIFMGLIYWFFSHFTGSKPKSVGAAPAPGGGYTIGGYEEKYPVGGNKIKTLLGIPEVVDPADRKTAAKDLKDVENRINKLENIMARAEKSGGDVTRVSAELMLLIKEQQAIQRKLGMSRN